MIVFDLKCRREHVFEAWFPDGASFAEQVETGKVRCPVCGSRKVIKAPMAPKVHRAREARQAVSSSTRTEGSALAGADPEKTGELRRLLRELRDHVESNCDYVGERFAEEARRIHYGESDPRGIYGETSDDEAEALSEEGIEVARVPWLRRENS